MSQLCSGLAYPSCAAGRLCVLLWGTFLTKVATHRAGVMCMRCAAGAGCGKRSALHCVMGCSPCCPDHALGGADNLRVELWGPFLTVSGTRKGGAMGMRDPARRSTGGKGVVLRREMDYGFFSASWRLPVSSELHLPHSVIAHAPCGGPGIFVVQPSTADQLDDKGALSAVPRLPLGMLLGSAVPCCSKSAMPLCWHPVAHECEDIV